MCVCIHLYLRLHLMAHTYIHAHVCCQVCIDGSQGSRAALRWTVRNYYRTGDTILLIHCQPLMHNPGAGYGAGKVFKTLEVKEKKKGQELLQKVAR